MDIILEGDCFDVIQSKNKNEIKFYMDRVLE